MDRKSRKTEDTITLIGDDGEKIAFRVLEKTKLNGVNYLLVADPENGDEDCYVMKDTAAEDSDESSYEFVEDDAELAAIGPVFEALLGDEEDSGESTLQ
jgi:uncharacterized protein YrzB (UPF0473 family)